jgi:hypothetical protein
VPIRPMLLAAGLLAVVCGAAAQSPPPPPAPNLPPAPPATPDIVGPVLPRSVPGAPALPDVGPGVVPAPYQKSVEQMILDLEVLTAQKAQIEKKSSELRAGIRKKLDALNDRVSKIDGGKGKEAKGGGPARVGRVQLEGFAGTDEPKVLEVLEAAGLRPGQILRYPELEATRSRIERMGFKRVEVVELPNELESDFKDVLVRCEQSSDRR